MSEPTNYIAEIGHHLVDYGYSFVPIQPNTKQPGAYQRSQWVNAANWTRYASRSTTNIESDIWSSWPDAGIGIVTGAVVAVDIDITDSTYAGRIASLATERLGATPAIRIGCAPKRLLVYRTEQPFPGMKKHPIEVLGLGQQFVAYGVHPVTGKPYDWPVESLSRVPFSELPVITEDQARSFLHHAYNLLPPWVFPATLTTTTQGHSRDEGSTFPQPGTDAAIAAALMFIPNAELDYDSWVRVGMAIKGAIGDAGRSLFHEWSALAVKHVPAFTEKTWQGFKVKTLGAGTIYRLALDYGWQPPPSISFTPDGIDGRHPAQPLLDGLGSHQI